jgi:hypothetical protein
MPDVNSAMLETAALLLAPLLDELVFVGGITLGLLIDSPGAAPIRATTDVDVIAAIVTYPDYIVFSERLRTLAFTEDHRVGAPLCRWTHGKLILDVMPLNREVLGFSNRWYPGAMKSAQPVVLPNGIEIYSISAAYFLGTKFEAFRERGNGDFLASRDLEDFVAVIDGRRSILEEVESAPNELRSYLAESAQQLLREAQFVEMLPGYFLPNRISQRRLPALLRKLEAISRG